MSDDERKRSVSGPYNSQLGPHLETARAHWRLDELTRVIERDRGETTKSLHAGSATMAAQAARTELVKTELEARIDRSQGEFGAEMRSVVKASAPKAWLERLKAAGFIGALVAIAFGAGRYPTREDIDRKTDAMEHRHAELVEQVRALETQAREDKAAREAAAKAKPEAPLAPVQIPQAQRRR